MVYAGFWRRFIAHVIDWVVVSTIMCLVWVPLGMIMGGALVGQDLIHAAQIKHAEKMAPHSEMNIVRMVVPLANNLTIPQAAPAEQRSLMKPMLETPAAQPLPAVIAAAPVASVPPTASNAPFDATKIGAVFWAMELFIYLLMFIASAIYHTWFTGSKWQATPGKRIMNCVVVTRDGTRISYAHAFGRHMACALSWLPFPPFCIGFFLAGWTQQSTALHDLICSTRVARTQTVIPPVLAVA